MRLVRSVGPGVSLVMMFVAAVVLLVWAVSGWWWVSSRGNTYSVMASQGVLIYGEGYRSIMHDAKLAWGWLPGRHPAWKMREFRGGAFGMISLGPPGFGVLLVGAALRWVSTRHPRGHCRRCGYDLRGLLGRVCPECGTVARSTVEKGTPPVAEPADDSKKAVRRRVAGVVAAMSAEAVRAESRRAWMRAVEAGLFPDGAAVMIYAPIAGINEILLAGLAEELTRRGCRLCVPRIDGATKSLAAARVENLTTDLIPDTASKLPGMLMVRPGTPELSPAELDVVVVPGVAFDRSGARLGRGAGYYDRFLAGVTGGPGGSGGRPVRVAIAFDEQIVERVPTEAHDQRVHVIVTPTEVIRVTG